MTAAHITRANGGVSKYILDFVQRINKNRHNVYVTSAGGEYLDEIKKMG